MVIFTKYSSDIYHNMTTKVLTLAKYGLLIQEKHISGHFQTKSQNKLYASRV